MDIVTRLEQRLGDGWALQDEAALRIKILRGEIERLREELDVTRLQRDAKLSSQTAVDEAAAREIERLRTALERIDVETADEYAREIAREAIRDDVEYAPNGMAYDD